MTDVDAVVAGGGIAGSAAAAALAGLGWSVLIVEPGQHDGRRLAGELIHPAGVAGLAELGLLGTPAFDSAARLDGFAIFPEPGMAGHVELPYRQPGVALALDHTMICKGLLATVAGMPGVIVEHGWRVTGLLEAATRSVVQIRRGGVTQEVRCRLVVAADGASSPVRTYAGLQHRRTRNAVVAGYLVGHDALPLADRGHIFTATGGPVLAYPIGSGQARVLFNRPLRHDDPVRSDASPTTGALPPRLRNAVEAAIAARSGRRFVSSDVAVSGVARGHVVLVGDAAGTCHPITASGMTMGVEDALRLAGALRRHDVASALALYAAERRSRQRARVLLAALMHDALGGAEPEMGMLRGALNRYWAGSARARATSMALLTMDDASVPSMLFEFARVAVSGLLASGGEPVSRLRRAALIARLPRPLMRHLVGAMRVQ